MIPVRQSTAFETAIGPILDADGVAVTGGVVGDFKIKKTTGNFAALDGSATLTHVSAGVYDLVLTTSDLDTVGACVIAIDDTTNACQSLYLQVMEEVVYDALYAASANAFTGAAGSTKVTGVVLADTVTTLTNLPAITANWLTAAGIQDGALTAAKFASGAFDAVWTVTTRVLTAATNITSGITTAVAAKIVKYFQLALRKDAAIATDNATELTELNANGGSGAGAFANTTDANEALRDRGDAAWITATGFAVAGDEMDLVDAPNATAIEAINAGIGFTGVT